MIWIAAAAVLVAIAAFVLTKRASGPHALARRGRADSLKALLARHPELANEPNAEGETPVHSAAKYDEADALGVLLDAGGHLNDRAAGGPTPLILAAAFNCPRTTDVLIRRGADLDVPDDHGVTALHFATRLGHSEIAKALLQAGAQVNLKASGETVLDVAIGAKQIELAEAVRKSGGRSGNDVHMRDLPPPKSLGKHLIPSVIAMPKGDPRFRAARTEAQRTLDSFKKLYREHPKRSAVKFDGGTDEFVWGHVTELRDDGMTVQLVSDPWTFSESGETRTVAWSEVADWLVEATDAQWIGGYSLKAMCEFVREEYGFLNGKYADVEKALVAP